MYMLRGTYGILSFTFQTWPYNSPTSSTANSSNHTNNNCKTNSSPDQASDTVTSQEHRAHFSEFFDTDHFDFSELTSQHAPDVDARDCQHFF